MAASSVDAGNDLEEDVRGLSMSSARSISPKDQNLLSVTSPSNAPTVALTAPITIPNQGLGENLVNNALGPPSPGFKNRSSSSLSYNEDMDSASEALVFVEPPNRTLFCLLCRSVFQDPVITQCGVSVYMHPIH
ncbi:uncharacterized protein [Diadema antillarum]|uniref:uncharacterized protein n=1 Tax=Diadema antillarum TaxID=105358 RepID=UPI003A89B5CA